MKKAVVSCFILFQTLIVLSQDSIVCGYGASKNKMFFLIKNTSKDTIRLSNKLLYRSFWENPVLNQTYRISSDTIYIMLFDRPGQSIQSDGEPLKYYIDGVRSEYIISPKQSVVFYLKIKDAKKIIQGINQVKILNNKNVLHIHTIRLSKKDFRPSFKPIKKSRVSIKNNR
jgi:hypothetical protein